MGSNDRGHARGRQRLRRIYIIELDPDLARSVPSIAPHLSPGQRCFYVGETGKDPSARVAEHRDGKTHGRDGTGKRPDKPKRVKFTGDVRKHLGRSATAREMAHRKRMSAQYEPFTYAERDEREREVICELRSRGHLVYPRSVGSDEWPFESTSAATPRDDGGTWHLHDR